MSQASVVLTIDKNRLRDLWLVCVQEAGDTAEYMDRLCTRAYATKKKTGFKQLSSAYAAMQGQWFSDVEAIRQRGGLLLIGGKF